MTGIFFPPMETLSLILTIEFSFLNWRETKRYGAKTGMTLSTPGKTSKGVTRKTSSGPIKPITVRSTPREMLAFNPSLVVFSRIC